MLKTAVFNLTPKANVVDDHIKLAHVLRGVDSTFNTFS